MNFPDQNPSAMPTSRYAPFMPLGEVGLIDRSWPTKKMVKAPKWASVDPVSYTHLTLPTTSRV